jgi:hypothetical protein
MPRAQKRQQIRYTIAIVGDGQTERIYFSDVVDTDRPPNLSIFPDYPRRIGNYKGVFDRAMILKEDYSRVYALIDMDKVIQDGIQITYRSDKAKAEAKGVIVLENNPCFEIWILLHFVHTSKLFNGCNQVSTALRKPGRIPAYEKSEKFLRKARLYSIYKTQLREKAIVHPKRLEIERDMQDELFPRAQTFEFFEWYFEKGEKNS